jgi:ATP-dependent RNA helicase RhlE
MGFARFELTPSLFQNIIALGYAEPTPIQAQAIPEALKGRDVRACAQTGTGKTCAFMVPIVEKLLKNHNPQRPSVLILSPTRELAAQIVGVAHGLIKQTRIRTALVLGGASFNVQAKELRSNVDIVVATPGRLMDHVQQRTVNLRGIDTLVLDEADRMLDMGFLPDIKRILSYLPAQRQTMLFSATYDAQIKELTHQFLKNPAIIEITSSTSATSENVTQLAYPVQQHQKRALLQAILELGNMTSALIFSRTKHGANKLYLGLKDLGKTVSVIHSNRSQAQRQAALQGFKEKRYQILVATDIAARGIDVKDISHVINFDVPRHAEDYVHRIGRTGRAQAVGEAFTLVAPDEMPYLKKIEAFIKKPIPRGTIPDFPYQTKGPEAGSNKSAQPSHNPRTPHTGGNRSHSGGGQQRQHNSNRHPQRGGGGQSSRHGRPDSQRPSQSPYRDHNPPKAAPTHSQPARPDQAGSQPSAPKKRWDWRRHR